jgi:iron only hydrogenase large subunit-like protein
MVVQTAPSVRVAIGEELGMEPGAITTGQLVSGLKALGFDHVFDTGTPATSVLPGQDGVHSIWLHVCCTHTRT